MPKQLTFRVLSGAGCTQSRSDEFDGTTLGAQWTRHTRNGGSPASAFTFADGQLHMPTADFELDGNAAATALGPVNFIGQDLNALGDNWQVETEFTVKYTGGWQNTGLIIWKDDGNFVRSSITHSLTAGNIYVEQSKDNPSTTTAEGSRAQAGSNITIAPDKANPITIRMRYTRTNGSNTVVPQYRVMAPAAIAMANYANFGGPANFIDLNPANGPRRDAAGSRIGIITQSNFPGTTGTHQYNGTPGTVDVNYFRVTPDPYTCETTAPTTTATLDPAAPATGDTYDRAVKVTLAATDAGTGASGVDLTEYRVNTNGTDGQWKTYTDGITVSSSGTHVVEYRSTDKAANTEAPKSVTFKIQLPVCERSDEFDGTEIRGHWSYRHATTPATGAKAPTVADGSLSLPLGSFSVDLDRTGPIGFIGQPLPEGDFTAVTKITATGLNTDTGGQGSQYAQVGLKLFQNNNNWIKIDQTRNADGNPAGSANSYFEMSTETNGTRVLGTRGGLAAPAVNLPTFWLRVVVAGGTLTSSYSLTDPAGAGANWISLGTANVATTLPTSAGPRYIGPYGGNGSITAKFDYIRITPDVCPDPVAPVTTAELDPAAPGAGGTYTGPVTLSLNATDEGSGVEKTEYQVTTSSPFGALGQAKLLDASEEAWVTYNAASKPRFTDAGNYSIEYRSVDKAGNVEAIKTIAFKIVPAVGDDTLAPTSTATLAPASPGAGGTYEEPVTVTFAATDPAQPAPGGANVEVQPFGTVWTKPTVDLKNGDRITWTWPDTEITGHDLRLRAPGAPGAANQLEVLSVFAQPNNPPITKTFTQNGAWQFICTLHSTYNAPTDSWTGMVGTANVTGSAPAVPAISGVDYTEYRVNGGAWTKGTTVTVSAVGAYAVEYRSADKAGNVETAKSVAFSIKAKVTPTPTRATATPTATATATATPNTPAADADAGRAGADGHPRPQAQAVVYAGQAGQDDGGQVRQERAEGPGHVLGGDERSGDGDGDEQGA